MHQICIKRRPFIVDGSQKNRRYRGRWKGEPGAFAFIHSKPLYKITVIITTPRLHYRMKRLLQTGLVLTNSSPKRRMETIQNLGTNIKFETPIL